MQVPTAQIGLQEEAAELEVRFDPSQLHQVVWNLCDNAIKYGEPRRRQRRNQDRPFEVQQPAVPRGRRSRPGIEAERSTGSSSRSLPEARAARGSGCSSRANCAS
jgi:hypothetical protein